MLLPFPAPPMVIELFAVTFTVPPSPNAWKGPPAPPLVTSDPPLSVRRLNWLKELLDSRAPPLLTVMSGETVIVFAGPQTLSTLSRRVPPLLTETAVPVERAPTAVRLRTPPLIVVAPVNVLARARVSVPVPDFVRLLPAPARALAKETFWPLVSMDQS